MNTYTFDYHHYSDNNKKYLEDIYFDNVYIGNDYAFNEHPIKLIITPFSVNSGTP